MGVGLLMAKHLHNEGISGMWVITRRAWKLMKDNLFNWSKFKTRIYFVIYFFFGNIFQKYNLSPKKYTHT